MRILLLTVLLSVLLVPACRDGDPQSLVAPEYELHRGGDRAGELASFSSQLSDENEMALPTRELRERTREAIVIQNCYIVRDAVEAFAAENGGRYPACESGCETSGGKKLIDFLPGGRLLWNPFSEMRCEPNEGSACAPGQIGYIGFRNRNHEYTGYRIEGYGVTEVIIVIEKAPTSGRGVVDVTTSFENKTSLD